MCVDPEPKVLLQNKMARAKGQLSEIRPILKAKGAYLRLPNGYFSLNYVATLPRDRSEQA